ncbi:MAG: RNA methyltransferase [Proteobacteria bacterium]|nr:MAG: RNA methyltransferase [Pseudomonadota bacterium]QKK11017.1 MAG: TfoX/Sxy family protein [Pseudomonadota bacterium]
MAWPEAAEQLAQRIRPLLQAHPGFDEKRMFGGLCFLLNGNMCCGVTKEARLMVRVGGDAYDDALRQPHATEMDFTGRPLKGMVFVDAPGFAHDNQLAEWIDRGIAFCGQLPEKSAAAKSRRTKRR